VRSAAVRTDRAARRCRPAVTAAVEGGPRRGRHAPSRAMARIARIQSANDGMKPRSSLTCCSPTQRVGMTLPFESVSVGPKTVPA
jgi:hypothetical protein